jgi:tetratricopeptide (TPR) repeat protein
MAEDTKPKRWLPRIVLIFSALVLLGVGFVPLFNASQSGSPSAPIAGASPDAQKKQLEDQLRGYEAVLQREPENPNALRGVIDAKRGLNDIKGTIAPLEKLVKLNPGVSDYVVLLAQTKQYLKDDEGAVQVYRDALKAKPTDVPLLSSLSQLLIKQDKPKAAIGLLQDALRDAPTLNQANPGSVDQVALQVLLGKIFASQKQFDEAYRVLETVIKEKPDNFEAYLVKALALQEQGKGSEAKPLFEKAASLAPAQYKDQIGRLATAPSPTASPKSEAKPDAAKPAPTDSTPDTKPSETPKP